MNILKSLWADWQLFTWGRAKRLAYLDEMLYGNSFVEERWWGFKRIHPLKYLNKDNFVDKENYERR